MTLNDCKNAAEKRDLLIRALRSTAQGEAVYRELCRSCGDDDAIYIYFHLHFNDLGCIDGEHLSEYLTGTKKNAKPLTIGELCFFMEQRGITCRFNTVSHVVTFGGIQGDYDAERLAAQAPSILSSMLKEAGYKSCDSQIVAEYLDVIAGMNRFNPVRDLLEGTSWDGVTRLPELFSAMRLADDDALSRTLITKWMMQAVSLCCLNRPEAPFGADGVLVLCGAQGCGKTTLARTLGISPELFKAGLAVDTHDKDTVLKATSCWIAELGELETTMKRDIPALKSFITDEKDEVRRPYARSTESHIRRTSFIATCNSADFLLDITGNRRFWTIPCDQPFDLNALAKINILQLWAEVYKMAQATPQGFRLTAGERASLDERNDEHTALIPAQAEILDILEIARREPNRYKTTYLTVSQFAGYYSTLSRYDARQIGRALDACGIHQRIMKRNGNPVPQRLREVPVPDRHFDCVVGG